MDRHGTLALFAVNRHLDEPMTLTAEARGFGGMALAEAHALHYDDLDAFDTRGQPDRIRPTPLAGVEVDGQEVSATLRPPPGTSSG